MAGRDRARPAALAVLLPLAALAACTVAYAPCPVELDAPLPAAAFAACKAVLAERYGSLAVADEASFRLQTGWAGGREACERRATVFRDGPGLAVVVERRTLVEPPIGLPHWAAPRGDPAAERALARALRDRLSPPR